MNNRICGVEGCGKPHDSHGYCGMHARRQRIVGAVGQAEPQRIIGDHISRFWSKVDKNGPVHPTLGQCWIWTASKDRKGYGSLVIARRAVKAHRYSCQLGMGMFWPMYQHLQVDHRCHVKDCVRPSHLRPASNKQNHEHLRGPNRNSTSGVRGVSWDKQYNCWQGRLGHNGKSIYVGRFATLAEAEAAVQAKRLELHTHNDVDRNLRVDDV